MTNLHDRSIEVIRAGQAPSGAYVASPTFSQYGYSWLRDGAWIAYAMTVAGQHDSAEAFFSWVGRTLIKHQTKLERLLDKMMRGETPDEHDYLPTRFTLDGDFGTEFWTNFQLDGYGTWLWALEQYTDITGSDLWRSLRPSIELTVRYLAALWRSSNYDCWEEFREEIHPVSLAAMYAGLQSAQRLDPSFVPVGLAEQILEYALSECVAPDGHFAKFVGNHEVDSSLLWIAVPYELVPVDDPRFVATLAKIERDIRRAGGGVYRYAADTYYGGGEWVLLTAWLGWTYVKLGRLDEARALLEWVEAQATPTGELPEQVHHVMLDSSRYAEWEAKWGTPACPLLWSHAMYLVLEAELEKAHG